MSLRHVPNFVRNSGDVIPTGSILVPTGFIHETPPKNLQCLGLTQESSVPLQEQHILQKLKAHWFEIFITPPKANMEPEYPPQKGDSYWKPPFSGSMLNFWGVVFTYVEGVRLSLICWSHLDGWPVATWIWFSDPFCGKDLLSCFNNSDTVWFVYPQLT